MLMIAVRIYANRMCLDVKEISSSGTEANRIMSRYFVWMMYIEKRKLDSDNLGNHFLTKVSKGSSVKNIQGCNVCAKFSADPIPEFHRCK